MASQTNTRERLLEAAIAVLETHGEAGIRVDELARAADVAKPSIYHYFGSREGLVAAALAEMYRRAMSVGVEQLQEIARSATTRDEFVNLFRAIIASFSSEDGVRRRAFRAEVLGAAVSRPELQNAIAEMHQHQVSGLMEFFAIGQQRGFVKLPFDPRTTALWATSVVFARHIAEIDPSVDLAGWDEITAEAFTNMLLGEPDK